MTAFIPRKTVLINSHFVVPTIRNNTPFLNILSFLNGLFCLLCLAVKTEVQEERIFSSSGSQPPRRNADRRSLWKLCLICDIQVFFNEQTVWIRSTRWSVVDGFLQERRKHFPGTKSIPCKFYFSTKAWSILKLLKEDPWSALTLISYNVSRIWICKF